MPVIERDGNFYWGKQGPFSSRKKAEQVARAAYASGYKKGALAKFITIHKGKYKKSEVQYGPATADQVKRNEMCGTCYFFDSANKACQIVGGFIHHDMWCNKWEPMDTIAKEFSGNVFTSSDSGIYTPTHGKYRRPKSISAKDHFKRIARALGLTVE